MFAALSDFYFELPLLLRLVIQGGAVMLFMFPVAAACSMAERKIAAWIQDRPGPNRTATPLLMWIPILGPLLKRFGVMQLMADGGKFLFKEDPVPAFVEKLYFIAAPIVAMIPALCTVVIVPFSAYIANINGTPTLVPVMLANVDVGLLAVFAVSSLAVYSQILAGWASHSKYSFLGGVRASAQIISYELSLTLSVLPVFLWINGPLASEVAAGNTAAFEGSLSLFRAVQFQTQPGFWGGAWFIFLMPLSAFIYLVALFAETNRQPFDTIESEADLVNSFASEYGAYKWSLFYVAEYCHMLVGSAVFVLLFFGGWNPLPWVLSLTDLATWLHIVDIPLLTAILGIIIFVGKVLFMIFFFMWVRWTLPRFRYDQVMNIGWKKLLPLSIANLVVYTVVIAFLS
ncbi:complex I subunit 1/NuoH family protein [Geminisphaera colitermitum]|uniref:complex I subunit 1/NuoH family protein n=1 Tax=Geminisphaera colitermitum TaxID=1148786 RepID=UPI000158D284|nr:complex I subunit 1 family protein [Geminisphaera colitermitum]